LAAFAFGAPLVAAAGIARRQASASPIWIATGKQSL